VSRCRRSGKDRASEFTTVRAGRDPVVDPAIQVRDDQASGTEDTGRYLCPHIR
jgi:hypothetical protein